MSNKDIRILLNTPSKEEGEEQLDELLPLAAGLVGGAAKEMGKEYVKAGKFVKGKGVEAGKFVKGKLKAAKEGRVAKAIGKVANVATGAAVIGAKAARKGVEAGASGDVKKLGTRVGLGRRGEMRRRKAEAESIAQRVQDKLAQAQNKPGSQTNSGSQNKTEPKQQPQGGQTAAEFDKENKPNSSRVAIRSNTPYPKYRKGLKRLSRGGSPQMTRLRRASVELTKQQKKAGMSPRARWDSREDTTNKRFS